MSDVEGQAESRLDNLQNIEPLLASLRILSLSTLQMAGNRKTYLNTYKQNFFQILAYLNQHTGRKPFMNTALRQDQQGKALLVVLGSDRGMCGTYNKTLAVQALSWLETQVFPTMVLSFGTRLSSSMRQSGIRFQDGGSLSSGSLPDYRKAHEFVMGWLEGLTDRTIRSVEILAFRKRPRGTFKSRIERLIPQEIDASQTKSTVEWPEPIIEGNPQRMINFAYNHLTSLVFQEIILESIEAENSIRYNLLEEAKDNIEELVESLTLVVQAERRQAITEQIQELATSAGLYK